VPMEALGKNNATIFICFATSHALAGKGFCERSGKQRSASLASRPQTVSNT
jgi:hypothetical protein